MKRGARDCIKSYKWESIKVKLDWWNNLSIEEKVAQKTRFERFRLWNLDYSNPYPYVYDLRHLRISQLSDKHIDRIHTFKDFKFE